MLKIETTYRAWDKGKKSPLFRIVTDNGSVLPCGHDRHGILLYCSGSLDKVQATLREYETNVQSTTNWEKLALHSRKLGANKYEVRKRSPQKRSSWVQSQLAVVRMLGIEYDPVTIVIDKMTEREK